MLIFTLFGLTVAAYLTRLYLKFKPFFDLQKQTAHADWAILKMIDFNPSNFCKNFSKVMENRDSFWNFQKFTVISHDPDDIKTIFNSDFIIKKLQHRENFKNGILVEFNNLKAHKKILSPLFQPSTLRQNIRIINEVMDEFLLRYKDQLTGHRVNAKDFTYKYIIRVVLLTVFGVQRKFQDHEIDSIKRNSDEISILISSRTFKPWLMSDFLYNRSSLGRKIHKLREELMFKVLGVDPKKIYMQQEANPDFFISMLKKIPMTYGEFFESTAFFISASSNTSNTTLANTLLLLAMNPNAQNTLYDELKSVSKSFQEHVSEETITQMPYLDLVIKETLRLMPLIFILTRVVTKSLKLKKYTLPAGTELVIPILKNHIDGKIWGDDALEFRPERFRRESFEKIHPYAYLPFSGGHRKCPGVKHAMSTIKIFISRIIMEYKVSTELKYSEIEFVMQSTLKTKQNIMILFEKRQ